MDLTQFLAGGAATRADSLTGLTPDFQSALAQMFAAAPPDLGLTINSAYRSPELQAQLWDQALAKYGSPEAARKWVAPPGRSQHGHGNAGDLGYGGPGAREWAHANAGNFGLAFPLSNEDWHIELAGARGGGGAPARAAPIDPQMAQQAMAMMPGGAAGPKMPGGAVAPGGMLLGDIAAQFLQGQQQKQQARQEEQEAEEIRRAALLGGGVAGLYG